jgi:hypothetical protein
MSIGMMLISLFGWAEIISLIIGMRIISLFAQPGLKAPSQGREMYSH